MISINIVLATILLSTSLSFAGTRVFSCQSQMEIDTNETENVSMIVTRIGKGHLARYMSEFTGLSFQGPERTTFESLTPTAALKQAGVQFVVKKMNLTDLELSRVWEVEVYTVGNFDDDLAGVRAVKLKNYAGNIISSGMFIGWAGPVVCQKN